MKKKEPHCIIVCSGGLGLGFTS